jgi:ABC-type multidrug transport system fused ATPase/permease subunit
MPAVFESQASPTAQPAAPTARPTARLLRAITRRYGRRLVLTYVLFLLENGLGLLQPLCLGLAIDDLLRAGRTGLCLLGAAYLGHLLVGAVRRVYDARIFTGVYRELAAEMVAAQRGRGVEVSRVATRSALARALVEFLEYDLPQAMHTICSLVGALALLWLYDLTVAAACALLGAPCWALSVWYRRRLAYHNRALHDEMEREVDVICDNRPGEVREHYRRLARSWVRIADWEAFNIGVAQLLLLLLLAGSLLHLSIQPGTSSGDIFAVLRYVLMFVTGVDGMPVFLRQLTRFQDIASRMSDSLGREGTPSCGSRGVT